MITIRTNNNLILYSRLVMLLTACFRNQLFIMCHIYNWCCLFVQLTQVYIVCRSYVVFCSIIYVLYILHFMLYIRLYLYMSKAGLMLESDL